MLDVPHRETGKRPTGNQSQIRLSLCRGFLSLHRSGRWPSSQDGKDRWLGTHPWLLVAGIVSALSPGFYQFIRISSKLS